MPTVNVDKENLFKELGKVYTTEEFRDLCFEFGIELEDDTSEKEMATKEMGAEKASEFSDRGIYRIDIPANRYDLLCPEGISQALKIYLGQIQPPKYVVTKPAQITRMTIKPETQDVRPYCACAILRNVTFDKFAYENFIELQDKLHNNICRRRTLVAIGTHDLDTLKGPFTYEALPPKELKFKPLNTEKEMDGEEIMTYYENHRKLGKYLHIIRDKPRYPIIFDSNRTVLSLPPIINGDHSKISLNTKNVFIECTATDLTKANIVLNTIVTTFSMYCKDKFHIEPVEVVYPDGTVRVCPDLSDKEFEASVKLINETVGVNLSTDEIINYLAKMSLDASLYDKSNTDKLKVMVPPTRSDVLHQCDIIEDVAIAYGYNNIPKTKPHTNTIGVPFPLNKLSDMIRKEFALSGFTEVLPLILCSHDENFAYMNRVDDGKTAVKLANPKTAEYQVVRNSLLPGIFKTIAQNKKMALPLKVFEVSDVVFKDDTYERKARNQRNMAAVYTNKTAGFEVIHGMLDRIMAMLSTKRVAVGEEGGYYIKESENPTFFPGRRADVYLNNKIIGSFGIVHPTTLEKFDINYPCSALEVNVEPFL